MTTTRTATTLLLLALGATALVAPRTGTSPAVHAASEGVLSDGIDTVLVDVADHLSDAERRAFVASLPGEPALNSVFSVTEGLYRIELTGSEAQNLLRQLDGHPAVEFAEPEAVYTTMGSTPNDPLYPFQWNFEQIDVEGAWSRATGDGVVVAVIDTGVAYADTVDQRRRRVRDLGENRIAPGYDFVDDDENPHDEHGHGTHVAGTIAQTTNNAYGVAGVAPNARIMPIRVLDAGGRGNTADIAESIRWAADNGADVINMSLGGPVPSRILQDAVAYAHRKGVTVVAAAGNNGWSMPSFPASYPHVISVAATQYDRTTTFYSNHGRTVDVAAPGGNTRVDQNDDGRPDGILQETISQGDPLTHEFALYMGTSMASPHVAGVAALLVELGVTSPDRLEAILTSTASRDVPSYSADRYGAGIIDAASATGAVQSRLRAPRAALALAALFAGFAFAGASGGRRRVSVPIGAGVAALFAAGLAPFLVVLGALGFGSPFPAWSAMAPIEVVFGGLENLAPLATLAFSALPAVAIYALFGGTRSRRGAAVVIGAIVGIAALLGAEAIAPMRDIPLIPGAGLLDRIWLAANSASALVIAFVALRKSGG